MCFCFGFLALSAIIRPLLPAFIVSMASTSVLRRCVGVRTLLRARSMSSSLTRAARTARSPACAVRRGVHTVVGSQSPAGSLPLDHDGAALTLIRYPICPFWCVPLASLAVTPGVAACVLRVVCCMWLQPHYTGVP